MNEMIEIKMILGHIRLVPMYERRGSKIYMGGYSIRYNENWREISRTENTWNGAVECWDEETARQMCASCV